ncbi:MAG: hypothetical protein Q8K32_09425 [Archangium sp.]|nr:hypothetical protein [Archangium sp.]
MAKQVDANQTAVVAALRAAGASVTHLHEVGKGCPDLLVGIAGKNYLVEVKDGGRPGAVKLTPDQEVFHRDWRGQIEVVTSAMQAFQFAKRLTAEARR